MWGHMGWGWGSGAGWSGGTWSGGGWFWGILGSVHMILWWVLLILAIVVLFRWLTKGSSSYASGGAGNRALDILKERYARGEIGKEEFEQKKRDLKA